jgi:serine/threonine protein kinase
MPADLRKARELFLHAIGKLPPEEWDGYVNAARGGDTELEGQLGQLIQVHREAGSFLDWPAAAMEDTGAVTSLPGEEAAEIRFPERPGTMIGPYKLLQQLGEGGMGTVFMAEQTRPVLRKVALKVIKAGMDSRQIIARFEAERQALAMMDHVNIARVLDAGTTQSGRPYFVMELIHGVPITKYCDDNHLSPRARLELFVPVCQAIQHAHQKGIIHRDVKPSNVMVTLYDGKPIPKVIDFGVAKATEQKLTERTLFTQFGTMVGTFEYMSPEQAEISALGVDTRSDIYSLGVLLYELLTGSTPLSHRRVREAAYAEILRMIKEEEPSKPSTRLSDSGEALASISAQRDMEPSKLTRLLRGELDWIVMKSLEKDRNRRYETANGFAADLQRFLNDEPVHACPASPWYRFRRFARRNKLAIAIASTLAAALLLGVTGLSVSTFLISRSYAAERKAHQQAEANFQRTRSAIDEYFTTVGQNKLLDVPGLQPLRKDLLEAAVRYYRALAHERSDDSSVRAGLAVAHFRLAEVNFEVDRNDDSIRELDAGLTLLEQLLEHNPGDNQLFCQMAGFWKGTRRMSVASPPPVDRAAAGRTLARFRQIWEELSAQNPAVPGFQSDLATLDDRLGQLLANADRLDEAVACSLQAVALWKGLVKAYPHEPEYQSALGQEYSEMAMQVGRGGKPGNQTELNDKALAVRETLVASYPNVGPYRYDLAESRTARASSLLRTGKTIEAEAVYRQVLESSQKLTAEYPNVPLYRVMEAGAQLGLGISAERAGRLPVAEKAFRRAVSLNAELMAESSANDTTGNDFNTSIANLTALVAREQPDEAEKLWRQALGVFHKGLLDHPQATRWRFDLHHTYEGFAYFLGTKNRHQEEAEARTQSVNLLEKLAGVVNGGSELWRRRELLSARAQLGTVLIRLKRTAEAEQSLRASIAWAETLAAEFPSDTSLRQGLAESQGNLADLLKDAGRTDEAVQTYRRLVDFYAKQSARDPQITDYRRDLAKAYAKQADFQRSAGQPREADDADRRALNIDEKLTAEFPEQRTDPENTGQTLRFKTAMHLRDLGNELVGGGTRLEEAEDNHRKSLAMFEKLAADFPNESQYLEQVPHGQRILGWVVVSTGRPAEAVELFRKAIVIFDRLSISSPKPSDREVIADTYRHIGHALRDSGKQADAQKAYSQALAIQEKLVAEFPTSAAYRDALASIHWEMGVILGTKSQFAEAEIEFLAALSVWEKLVADFPDNASYRLHLAYTYGANLAPVLTARLRPRDAEEAMSQCVTRFAALVAEFPKNAEYKGHLTQGRFEQAAMLATNGRWKEASGAYGKLLELAPASAVGHNNLAWLLATCPDSKIRDPRRAVELAKKAVELAPIEGNYWNTVGIAQYRAGDWKAAIAALEKTMALRKGGDGFDWFFQAMAHWQIGDKTQSRCWYDKAVPWMEKYQPKNAELVRFRAEAAALLGVNETKH